MSSARTPKQKVTPAVQLLNPNAHVLLLFAEVRLPLGAVARCDPAHAQQAAAPAAAAAAMAAQSTLQLPMFVEAAKGAAAASAVAATAAQSTLQLPMAKAAAAAAAVAATAVPKMEAVLVGTWQALLGGGRPSTAARTRPIAAA